MYTIVEIEDTNLGALQSFLASLTPQGATRGIGVCDATQWNSTGCCDGSTMYLTGIVDGSNAYHQYGILDGLNAHGDYGILYDSSGTPTYASWGIVDNAGGVIPEGAGILDDLGNKAAWGIIDGTGDDIAEGAGILDSSGDRATQGIIDASGEKHDTGIFDGTTHSETTGLETNEVKDGVTWADGDGSHEGEYEGTGGETNRRLLQLF
jgi:hypothetical protein